MDIGVDVWVRGEAHATTHALPDIPRLPEEWTDQHITELLTAMLRLMNTAKDPSADPDAPVVLRGFSWIVNPYEAGGVVLAIEMQLGAAVAGPFDVAEAALTDRINRVLEVDRRQRNEAGSSGTIH